jgi:hypothetical protein
MAATSGLKNESPFGVSFERKAKNLRNIVWPQTEQQQ